MVGGTLVLKLALLPLTLGFKLLRLVFRSPRLLWTGAGLTVMAGCLYAVWHGDSQLLMQFGGATLAWTVLSRVTA